MVDKSASTSRVFKTEWFSKAARKARIADKELCEAIAEVRIGKADDLGGGIFKKRLNRNMHRSIIVAKGKRHWIYEFLFAKKDMANIEDDELAAFRKLAKAYEALDDQTVEVLVTSGNWIEICVGVKGDKDDQENL